MGAPESRSRRLAAAALSVWIAALSAADGSAAKASLAEPVVPADLSALDPAVQRLIRQKLAEQEPQRRDAAAWGDLGLVYEANLLWLEARRCFQRAVELAPQDVVWRFHLALATREAGDFAGALRQLRQLAAEETAPAAALQHLGRALLASGEPDNARAAFSRLIDAMPSSPVGYLGAADALQALGRPDEAIPLLRIALELGPGGRAAHHRLGRALRSVGRAEEAGRELALGVGATDPTLPPPLAERVERYAVHLTARVSRAAGLLAAGRAAEARDLLELVLADHPENLTVLNNLAVAHLRRGELERARALLDRALAVNEAKFSTWINLTSWALRAGQPARALEYADAAVARGPESAQARMSRAQVQLRLQRPIQAAADLEAAATLDAGNPRPRLVAADLYRGLGRTDRARDLYRQAIDLQPDLLPALVGLGQLELSLGRHEAASRALEGAQAIAPEHPLVLELARALTAGTEGG